MELNKTCTRCATEKPLDQFGKQIGGRLGKLSVCRDCKKMERVEGRQTGRWYSHTKEGSRVLRMPRIYGITVAQYEDLWLHQDGKCALCSTEVSGSRKESEWLVIDHDHSTKEIRGLLCETCNMWLGNFEQLLDRAGLSKLLEYIKPNASWITPVFPEPKNRDVKVCSVCKREKAAGEFSLSNVEGGYRKGACKACEAKRVKAYYHSNEEYREEVRARSRGKSEHTREEMRGEGHPNAKLKEDMVREIKASEEPMKALARKYGVSRNLIRSIKRGERWAHVA